MNLIKNKKGDIPITILVIGVFVLCSLALLTFFIYDFRMSNSFVGVKVMEKMDASIDEYKFYLSNGVPSEQAKNYFNVTTESGQDYFYFEKYYYKISILKFSRERILLFSVKSPVGN